MENQLNARLRQCAQELWAIQTELIKAAATVSTSESDNACAYQGVDNDSLQDLKGAVDHMRHLLWVHLEEARKKRGFDLEKIIFEYRVRRVVEMVRLIQSDLQRQKRSLTPELFKMAEDLKSTVDELRSLAK